jgi:adenylate kinase
MIDYLVMEGAEAGKYLLATDQSSATQRQIMTSISEAIGSGAVNEVEISTVINEPWCDFLSVDVKLNTS